VAQDLVFDPVSEDAGNAELSVFDGSDGIELVSHSYPTPQLDLLLASNVDMDGELPVSRRYGNRTISLTVECRCADALRELQAKVAKVGAEGGTLQWTLPGGEKITFDLLAHQGFEPRFDIAYHTSLGAFCSVDINLLAKPFGRGAEEDLGDNVETTLPVLVFTETDIKGDVPALGRLVIDEDQSQLQRFVVWGLQSRHYSSAATAALFFQAESCTALNTTGDAGPSGASGSTLVDGALAADHRNQFRLTNGHVGPDVTHIGNFRVFARVQVPSTNAGTVSVAFQQQVGATIINNPDVAIDPAYEGHWVIVDLGFVHLPGPEWGIPYFKALRTLARSTANNDAIYWDWVILIPFDEGHGEAASINSAALVTGSPLTALGHLVISWRGVVGSSAAGQSLKPARYEGDNLLVPPGTARIIVKASRGRPINGQTPNVNIADAGIDDISARLHITPRYLVVPTPVAP
jgi:hypothetical protein